MKTVEVKTADLIGPALDWAVAKAESKLVAVEIDAFDFSFRLVNMEAWDEFGNRPTYSPSTDWAQGGPLVDKLMRSGKWELVPWFGGVLFQNYTSECIPVDGQSWDAQSVLATGKTVLIAACRATVYAHLGDTVSVPAELVGEAK